MECRDVQEQLTDLSRERLPAELAVILRAHLAGCVGCGEALRREERLRTLIQTRAPRYAAPAALRARVESVLREAERTPSSDRFGWLRSHPWMVGALAGAAAVLAVVWVGREWFAADPVSRLMAHAVEEHVEYSREAMDRPAPDATELLRSVASRATFPLGPVFAGDAATPLVSAVTGTLDGRHTVALIYRNAPSRYTTLLLMPGADVTIPTEDRLAIESFKPHHRVAAGKHVLYWKQRDLACLLVSDLDQSGLASMFLKVRKAS